MKNPDTFRISPVIAAFAFFLLAGGLMLPSCKNNRKAAPLTKADTLGQPADTLLTCRICGYRSLTSDTASCPVCFVQLSPSEIIAWGYRSLEEMIREEQAMFFAAEGYREQDFFFQPSLWEVEGALYRKDTTWSPTITEAFVLSMRDTLIRAGVIEQ